jgi:ferredoxin
MRIKVDYDLCESNGLCMDAAPEVFDLRDDDVMYVLIEEPDEELRPKVLQAISRCPKRALSLGDDRG